MKRILCWIFFHKLVVLREFGGSRLCYCLRCKKHFGMHDETKSFVPWDIDLENYYRSIGKL